MKKRMLSLLMVICMLISLFPASVMAEEPEIDPEDLQLEDVFLDEEDFREELLSEEEDEYPEEPEEAEEPEESDFLIGESGEVPETEEEPGDEEPGDEESEEPGTNEENIEETEPADPSEEPEDVATPSKEQEEPAEEEEAESTEEPETEETEDDDEEEKEVTIQAASGTCGDNLTWTLDDEGTLTISGTGPMDDYGYYSDYVDNPPWWAFRSSIKTVFINSGVTNIGDNAFRECVILKNVKIPNSVISIGDSAFRQCEDMTIEIPNNVISIASEAFRECRNLTNVKIPDSVTSIGIGAFSRCTSLTKVEIPNSVTSIPVYMFLKCDSLTSVEIPNSVTSIGAGAFEDCIGLKSVEIPDSVTSIEARAFNSCISLESARIPYGVTSINHGVFAACTKLGNMEIPNSVIYIEKEAFGWCESMTRVEIPNSVISIGESAFCNCTSMTRVEIPNSVTSIGQSAFYQCTNLESVRIPNSITSIESYLFYGCSKLKSVEIPNSVTSIGQFAFYQCTNLESVEIPSGVTYIEGRTFYQCISLTDVKIPSSVTSIGNSAFYQCTNLTSVKIPKSVTCICSYAYLGCSGLIQISFEHGQGDEIELEGDAFYLDEGLNTSIGVPDPENINSAIAEYDWAANHRNVTFAKYGTGSSINHSDVLKEGDGWKLNWECYGDDPADMTLEIFLTGNDTIGNTITVEGSPWLDEEYGIKKEDITKIIICGTERNRLDIGAEAFKDYTGVKTLMLDYINTIGTSAFESCLYLEQVDGFDEYIFQIGVSAFKNCVKLKNVAYQRSSEIVLPKCLDAIGAEAFMNTALEEMYLLEEVSLIGDNAFSGCEESLTIYCYPYTAAVSYAVNNRIKYELLERAVLTDFQMRKDSFSFSSGNQGNFPISYDTDTRYMTKTDYERLLLGSDNVQTSIIDHFMKGAGGECRGLAAAAVLVKMGLVMPSSFQDGVEYLYDVQAPLNERGESLINYYFLTQHLYNNILDKREFRQLSSQEQIHRIEALAEQAMNGGAPFLLEAGNGSQAHAVVCYGVEHCSTDTFGIGYRLGAGFCKNGKIYDSRFLIYDVNHPENNLMDIVNYHLDPYQYIYFNHDSNEWYWPSFPGYTFFQKATNDPTLLAPSPRGEEMKFYSIYSNTLSPYRFTEDGLDYWITPDINNGKIVGIIPSDAGESSQSGFVTTILIEGTDYMITPPASDCDFMIALEDALIDVACANALELVFHPNGSFTVGDVNGNYNLTLLFNEGVYTTPWYKTNIQGTANGTGISMSQTEDGILVEGANDGTVIVTVTDINGIEESFSFETEKETVLISTATIDGQEKPAALTDEDGDGSFEHVVSGESGEPVEPEITAPPPTEMSLDREYLLMNPGTVLETPLQLQNVDSAWLSYVEWNSENPDIARVDGNGLVTAGSSPGTTYIVASIQTDKEHVFMARCRVDVLDEAKQGGREITASLPVTQVATEIYKTDYTRFDVVLRLEQNVTAAGVTASNGEVLEDTGVRITDAQFVGSSNAKQDIRPYFDLRVVDDRTLEIIPTVSLNDAAKIKTIAGNYKSAVKVFLSDGTDATTTELTVKVGKALPKLTAKPVTVNGFIAGQTVPVEITGGRVSSVTPRDLGFATLNEDMTVTVKNGVTKSGKAAVTLNCRPDDWAVPVTLKLTVNNQYKAPKVTLKPTSVTVNRATGDTAYAFLTVVPLEGMNHEISVTPVSGLSAVYNPVTENVEVSAGTAAVGTYSVPVQADGKTVTNLKVKVIDSSASITAKASGAIDPTLKNSPAVITVTGKNYNAASGTYLVKIQQNGADVDSDLFLATQKGNTISITAGSRTPADGKYTATVSCEVGAAKPVDFTVKTSKTAPKMTATLKAAGSIDILRGSGQITVTPTIKNKYDYEESQLGLALPKGLQAAWQNGKFVVTAVPGANIDPNQKAVSLMLNGTTISRPVNLTLKQGKAVVAQSTKAVTLSKNDRYDRQSVILSLSDSSLYDIGNARVTMTDKSGNLSLTALGNGEYAIGYKNNTLPGNIARLKTATVKLNVFLQGNGGSKPNATLNVKVNFG